MDSVPAMFDFANPDGHSPQRFNTTVPQQALFLMNSPFMRARADIFATAEVDSLYRRILAREPTADEKALAQRFIDDATALNGEKPFRWSYGTFQCLWKHRRHFGRGSMGLVAMPNILIFQLFFPIVSPLGDLVLLLSILVSGLTLQSPSRPR